MKRLAWLVVAALVVLTTRALAYALEPSPLAGELHGQAGGPALPVVALVALTAAVLLAVTIVWLVSTAVEERRRLERRPVALPRIGLLRLAGRTVALFAASALAFALLEATIHWRAGLGWHGLDCLTGPVHRDATPILAALSLVAAAAFAGVELLVAWMRRTLARLAAVLPLPALPLVRVLAAVAPAASRRAPLGARGPPLVV